MDNLVVVLGILALVVLVGWILSVVIRLVVRVARPVVGLADSAGQAEVHSMDLIDCMVLNNGDIRLAPRSSTIFLGVAVGLILAVFGAGVLIIAVTSPASVTTLCVFPIAGLGLLALALPYLAFGLRGMLLSDVTFSKASQSVLIRQSQTHLFKDITSITAAPVGGFWTGLAGIAIPLLELAAVLGGRFVHTREGVEAMINAQQVSFQLADGRSVPFTAVPEKHFVTLRRILLTALGKPDAA